MTRLLLDEESEIFNSLTLAAMEKVWFKLKQTDYPPPSEESMGTGKETAPICLGHFISDLRHIDFVLNRHEIDEFPANMPVFPTTTVKFKWDDSKTSETGGKLGGGVPIATAAGLTVKANLNLLFKQEITNHEEYDRLDKYIVQITKSYVADCLASIESLAKNTRKPMWSMFVITGMMVARGATKMIASESENKEVEGGTEADVPEIASATSTAKIVRNTTEKKENSGASDFVFAVRLAKITKGLLQTDWSLDPFTKNATFRAGGEKVDVVATLSSEGMEKFHVIEDEELDYAFVVALEGKGQRGGAVESPSGEGHYRLETLHVLS